MPELRFLLKLSKWIWQLFALVVIVVAALVVLGRSAIENLPQYQSTIEKQLSEQIGYPITIDSLRGEWYGLNPRLFIRGFKLFSAGPGQSPTLTTDDIQLEPKIIDSLLQRRLVFRDLVVGRINLSLHENANGSWTLTGLGASGGEGNLESLEKLFFKSRLLRINSLTAQVNFSTGATSSVKLNQVKIENSGDFHRLYATLSVVDGEDAANLIIEGRGNPLNPNTFDGQAYLKLNQINNVGLFRAAFQHWLPKQFDKVGEVNSNINGEIWVSLNGQGAGKISGVLQAEEIPMNWFRDVPPLRDFKAEITGWYQQDKGWQVTTQHLAFNWDGHSIEPLNLSYSQTAEALWGNGRLQVSQVNLALLTPLIEKTGLLPDKAAKAIHGLNPTGSVTHLDADLKVDEANQLDFNVKGNLEEVSIQSIHKAPAARNVNGYFELHGLQGLLQISSPTGLEMLFPTAYDNYIPFGSLQGQINWQINKENDSLALYSGPLNVKGEEGSGVAYLDLDVPLKRSIGPGNMTLMVGMKNSHSRYRDRYIPRTLDPNLQEWLASAIGNADLPEVGFIWRGSLGKNDHIDRTIQLYLKTGEASLKFQPDWPSLEHMSAVVTVNDSSADGVLTQADLLDTRITHGDFHLVHSTEQSPLTLKVTGEGFASVAQGLSLLDASPLSSKIQPLLPWNPSGQANASIDLAIPLKKGLPGTYKVDVAIENGTLTDPSGRIRFTDVDSGLSYHTGKGLFTESLKGRLWGAPVSARLFTDKEGALAITGKSTVDSQALFKAFDLPLASLINGSTPVSANAKIPEDAPTTLELTTDLKGISVDLPTPFTKDAETPLNGNLNIAFSQDEWRYSFGLENTLQGEITTNRNLFTKGYLSINNATTPEQVEGKLLVNGELDHFDFDQWQGVYNQLKGQYSEGGVPILLGVNIGTFTLPSMDLTHVASTGYLKETPEGNSWQFDFTSDTADGSAGFPTESGNPIELKLSRLVLEKPVSPETEPSPGSKTSLLANVNQAELPLMNFSVDNLLFGEKTYGSLAFQLRPYATGAAFNRLSGNIGGISFGGSPDLETRLVWNTANGVSSTRFEGLLKTENIGDTLEFWGFPRVMESEKVRLLADLQWQGEPDLFDSRLLTGDLVLGAEKGVFYRSSSATASGAIMRTLGLLNFANWVRRLQLDFSDFFGKGLSYDEISGGLQFNGGIMKFDAPIKVKMPSGRLLLSGQTNLVTEQLDAGLVVTIPIQTNLPWIAALAGGLPAAAGVYLTSKLFESEVDSFSSLSYRVTGPWDDPEIAVDKIFSDKTDK